jgi:hypothetical protein
MKQIFHVVFILVVTGIANNCCIKTQNPGSSRQPNQPSMGKTFEIQAKKKAGNAGVSYSRDSFDTASQHNDNPVILDLLYADPANEDTGIGWLSVGHIL